MEWTKSEVRHWVARAGMEPTYRVVECRTLQGYLLYRTEIHYVQGTLVKDFDTPEAAMAYAEDHEKKMGGGSG